MESTAGDAPGAGEDIAQVLAELLPGKTNSLLPWQHIQHLGLDRVILGDRIAATKAVEQPAVQVLLFGAPPGSGQRSIPS